MLIHSDLHNLKKLKFPIITIGSFDGVHLGHLKILNRLVEITQNEKGESILFTFSPHPQQVLNSKNDKIKFITTPIEKIELLRKTNIDHLIIYPFTKEFSKISFRDFISKFLIEKLMIKKIITGYDNRFGNNKEGNYESLKNLGSIYHFEVEEIKPYTINGIAISSSEIRKALLNGNIKTANNYLGYNYSITGKVISGNQVGRKIGFPTANIEIDDKHKLIPANGVYAVYVKIENFIYKGMANIGTRPTLNLKNVTLEVNIFNFDKNIYNQPITLYFIDRIRDEFKFIDLNALKTQLEIDKSNTLQLL